MNLIEPEGYYTDDPICALATPLLSSPISVIRISGESVISLFAPLFSGGRKLLKAEGNTIHYGKIVEPDEKIVIDHVTVALYRKPKSYTGEESIEIFSHGSVPGVERLLKTLQENGFRLAAPGEFTLRAFLNGKVDLTEAEAVHELIMARTKTAHKVAVNHLQGELKQTVGTLREALLQAASLFEVQLDYPEDEVEVPLSAELLKGPIETLESLIDSYKEGRLYREGVEVVLVGATNTGKSSLFNCLLKEERAIVSQTHGTTRDYLEGCLAIEGVPVSLYDTAGLRDSDNSEEREGIRRTTEIIKRADILLYLIDGTVKSVVDSPLVGNFSGEVIKVWSKSDIAPPPPPLFTPANVVERGGIDPVLEKLKEALKKICGGESHGVIVNSARQVSLFSKVKGLLTTAQQHIEEQVPVDMTAQELREAIDILGEVTGETFSESILDSIFGQFCLGK